MARDASQRSVSQIADLTLSFLVDNPPQLDDFMTITGMSGDELRRELGSKSLATGLIDYLVQNESVLLAVCERGGMKPESVMRAWALHNGAE